MTDLVVRVAGGANYIANNVGDGVNVNEKGSPLLPSPEPFDGRNRQHRDPMGPSHDGRGCSGAGGSHAHVEHRRPTRRRESLGDLAAAAASFMDQARVTGDAAWYARAEAACDHALALAPAMRR